MADLVAKLDELEEKLKHQPGQHDQRTHGHRKGGGGSAGSNGAPKEVAQLRRALGGEVVVGGKGTPYPKNGGVIKTKLSPDAAHARIKAAGYSETTQGHFSKGNVKLRTAAVGPPRGKKKTVVTYTISK